MQIAVIGASSAGLYAAILLKRKHPDWKVDVFDRVDKIGKKLLATGNGHCNLLNLKMVGSYYNDPAFVNSLLSVHPLSELLGTLDQLGIATLTKGDLVYPLSYSSSAHVKYLSNLAAHFGVNFHLGEEIKDYEAKGEITLFTSGGPKKFDKVIFATGGASQPNLGSNGGLFPVFAKHGYALKSLVPSLCPIKTKEKTKAISGCRHEAKITLIQNKRTAYEEVGEVLFKDDGISGIAVFNASAYLARNGCHNAEVVVDLFPNQSKQEIDALLNKANIDEPYLAFVEEKLGKYLLFAAKMQQMQSFSDIAKALRFHVDSLYPFAFSQVSHGGLEVNQIGLDFASKKENGIYFIGEMLNIDGLCGGFNLGFALASALGLVATL